MMRFESSDPVTPAAQTVAAIPAPAIVFTLLAALLVHRLFFKARRPQRSASGAANACSTPEDADFHHASEHVHAIRDRLAMKERFRLYSYYKQGTCGDAPLEAPPAYMVVDHAKHSSWARRRGLDQRVAKAKYVSIVHELDSAAAAATDARAATAAEGTAAAATPAEGAAAGEDSVVLEPRGQRRRDGSNAQLAVEGALRARIVQLEAMLARMAKVEMRGWLHRYRPDAASWLSSSGSRWDRRFFVVVRDNLGALQLNAYVGESALVSSESVPLANCVVIDEGFKTKQRNKQRVHYRVFSVWVMGTLHSERGPGAGALLRASCTDEREAARWLEALEEATGQRRRTLDQVTQKLDLSPLPPPRRWHPPAEASAGPPATSLAVPLVISGSSNALATSSILQPPPLTAATASTEQPTEQQPPTPEQPATPGGSRRSHRAPFDPNLFPASRPMHRSAQPSLLSGGVMGGGSASSEPANLSGFINLVLLLCIVTNSGDFLENILAHGLLISRPNLVALASFGQRVESVDTAAFVDGLTRALRTAAVLLVPVLGAYTIERAAVKRTPFSRYSRRFVDPLHTVNVFASLAAPCGLVAAELHYGGAAGGVLLLIGSVTGFLKLVSWAHVHHDLREADAESREEDSLDERLAKFRSTVADTEGAHEHYPSNVTLRNLAWFLVAPTLCYQLDYPRTARIRKTYLISLCVRLLVLWSLLPAFVVQYMGPLLEHSVEPLIQCDVLRIVERLLKLGVPVTYCWLLGFYAFFHVWLNLLAELTRFGDRVFYRAWWNATDFETYWRTWNMPVHMWVVRHAYFPIQRHVTSSKVLTGLYCFTLSAVLHELVVAFPLHSYHMPLAFVGMMSQVPMLPLSSLLKKRTQGTAFEQSGNFLFWITFCLVGQPLCVLLYYVHATQQPGGGR